MNNQVAQVSKKELAAAEQAVLQGYKQTEVGVIPEDWDALTIDDIAIFSGGSQPPRSTFIHIPQAGYIRLIQIRDYKTSDFETYIPIQLARKLCSRHDIMIGRYGPPIFQILRGIEGAYNVALIKAVPKSCVYREYLYYFLSCDKLFDFIDKLSQRSSGQTGVELPALKAYPVPLPPIEEQTAIANALSDVDALIGSLEALIAKKQAIKTATMQQLLTGRTRLPQFAIQPDGSPKGYKTSELGEIPEDWEVKSIGQLCHYQNGTAQEKYFNSYDGYKVVSIGNYSESGRYIKTGSYIDRSLKSIINKFVLQKGDLAMILNDKTSVGTIIGRVIHIDADNSYVMNQRTMRLSSKGEVSSVYLHLLINSDFIHKRIVGMAKPGTQIYVNTDDILNFQLQLPLNKDEQTAIATILSDMDEEIQTLETRLTKTRDLKQGMMQQLLTGKIRLVKPLAGDEHHAG